jgi:hypothetical protein
MKSSRHFPIFVVGSLGVLTKSYEKLVETLEAKTGWRHYVLIALATGLVFLPALKIAKDPDNDYPISHVALLREAPCRGDIFNDFDFGGYMIWQLPGKKVYIDGRMPSWADTGGNYFVRWQRVLSDETYARSEFKRYNVGCALVYTKRERLIGQLEADGWKVSLRDANIVLLRAP